MGGSKSGYCTVKINDYIREIQIGNLKSGTIKYPYHPSVCGIGYIGDNERNGSINTTKEYMVWHSMIRRCYSSRCHTTQSPTYSGCVVDSEWHNFQVFKKWFEENYVDGFELDKDLLIEGNKIYSKNTCIFIPRCLNTFIRKKQSSNKSGQIGVHFDNSHKKWRARICDIDNHKNNCLGLYETKYEASNAYKLAHALMVTRMKNKMMLEYGITDLRILDAIR